MPLPSHGKIDCNACFHSSPVTFDKTKREEEIWRITNNPIAWGNNQPEVLVLGFSKGQTQTGALSSGNLNSVPFKGHRKKMAKVLAKIGIMKEPSSEELSKEISSKTGRFHFGSLIRCAVERHDLKKNIWKGSGCGMLNRFIATPFGREISQNCAQKFLSELPPSVKLIVMFGLGSKLNYVEACFKIISEARGGNWRLINKVAYTNGNIVVVHVEHFASQGALLPNWLGENDHPRQEFSKQAIEAVQVSGVQAV